MAIRASTLSCPSCIRLSMWREKPLHVGGDSVYERFDPSGQSVAIMQCSNEPRHSMTSSALASSVSGKVRPSAWAVRRLIKAQFSWTAGQAN